MIKITERIMKLKADRLISITSIPHDGKNTLYYHLSYDGKHEIREFSIDVPKNQKVETLIGVYKNAILLEAEVTELFGVYFEGNPRSGKRFLQAEGNEAEARKAFTGKTCPGGNL